MMGVYRSLLYRKMMLTWKHYLLFFLMYLLLVILLTLPALISIVLRIGPVTLPDFVAEFFALILALTGGLASGSDNNLHKSDVSSGWKRYSYVLPVDSHQKAMTDLLVKLIYFAVFAVLASVSTLMADFKTGFKSTVLLLNTFLLISAVVWFFDAIESEGIMLGIKNGGSKAVMIIAAAAILFFTYGKVPETENSISLGSLMKRGSSLPFTALIFAGVCFMYYFTMKLVYERRER